MIAGQAFMERGLNLEARMRERDGLVYFVHIAEQRCLREDDAQDCEQARLESVNSARDSIGNA